MAVLRRASRGIQQAAAFAYVHMRTRHRTLSLGMRRTMRACGVRAPRRAGWSRLMPYGSPLLQRDGPLVRCMAVFRRASRGLQRALGVACAHTRERATVRSLSGGGAPRALAARALHAALVGVGPYSMEAHRASETALSLGAWPCSDVTVAASNQQTAFACVHSRTRHRTLALGRRRTRRACGACAPRRAGWSRSVPYGSPLCQQDGHLPQCTAVLRRFSRGIQRAAAV